ncbi:MAG: ATP-binding protein [Ginsengibacter sp.]
MKTLVRHIFLLSILLAYSFAVFSQAQWIDSVKRALAKRKADTNKVNTLINLSDAYRFSYPDSALIYAQKALALAERLHSDNQIFWSVVAANASLYVLGNYTLELDYAFKALPIAKKLNNPYTTGFSNGMLSDCYYNLGEYDTSLKYWRKVIQICEQDLPGERYAVYGNSSRIFNAMHQYDSALIYAKKSYELIEHTQALDINNYDGKRIRSILFTALGDAFEGKENHDSATFYYRMSIPYSAETHMEVNKIDDYNGMATVFQSIGRQDSAIWYAKKALDERIAKTYPLGLLKAANLLAAVYESKNNPDSSLKYLHISLAVKDSLFNREKTIAFQNIIFKEQEKQKDVEAAKIELQKRYRMYFLVALLTISLVIAGITIRNRRIRQLQNIRNRIADDLHDDIGSTLSSISIMNELAKAKSPDAFSLLTSIGESTSAIQENMGDIVWAIKAGNDRFENVLQRMNQFASEILDSKNIELEFASDASLSAIKLTMEQRKNFYFFFKEVINNAAKHSRAEKVSVCIDQKDHHIEMNINDNGKGFDANKIFSGNGMNTLKKRAAELNGDFKIASNIHEGTHVQLKFKIT